MFFFSKESNKLYPDNNFFRGGGTVVVAAGCSSNRIPPPHPHLLPFRLPGPCLHLQCGLVPAALRLALFASLGLESEFLGWVLHLQWTQNPRPAARFPHSSGGIPYSKEIKAVPKEINPEHVLEGLKLKLQYFGCLT